MPSRKATPVEMLGSDELFNLPVKIKEDRYKVYSGILSKFAGNRKVDILEIGVFRAGIIRGIFKTSPEIVKSYTGVDPYIGDDTDPYFKSYWKSDIAVARTQYEESRDIFEKFGATLIRQTSDAYFKATADTFDIIIVDGDHRQAPALRDLNNALERLRPGGLLVCDDYGNSDTPDVTRAVVKFVQGAGAFYDAAGFRPIWFQNAAKPAPIQLSIIYWRKLSAGSASRETTGT